MTIYTSRPAEKKDDYDVSYPEVVTDTLVSKNASLRLLSMIMIIFCVYGFCY